MALKCKKCKNCRKCNLITFGNVDKKFIIIVIGGIVYSLQLYIESKFTIFGEGMDFPIIYTMLYSISLCFAFIFLIIYKVSNKKKTSFLIENRVTEFHDIPTINSQKTKTISWIEKLSWIFLASIIDFIGYLFSAIYWLENDSYVDTLPTNIIFMAIFAYFILKMKLYRHHILCIIIIILRGASYTLICHFAPNNKEDDLLPNIVSFLTEIGFSLTYVMYKYYMLIKFIHPYEIMFFEGVFELIFSIITLIIARSMNKLDKIEDFISKFKGIEILLIISWIIACFIYHSTLFKIIDTFSPFYIHISLIISEIISLFLKIGEDLPTAQIIFYILSFIICPFMILVFIEIIELNFCRLSYMTRQNIENRARLERLSKEEIDINKEKDDEIFVGNDEYFINLLNSKSEEMFPLEPIDEKSI